MSKHCDLSNYDIAKAEADRVDEQIIAALKAGRSFRVEAGAGSGKTYSLNRRINEPWDNRSAITSTAAFVYVIHITFCFFR